MELKDAQKNVHRCTDCWAGGKNCWSFNMRLTIWKWNPI